MGPWLEMNPWMGPKPKVAFGCYAEMCAFEAKSICCILLARTEEEMKKKLVGQLANGGRG